ncbi:MAG: FeoB-associated Cys-rich membrane protein [Prevotella sp.]|nr:FeoB-associated Cys-rich membrane protein [Prevotella sp.]
MQLTIVYIVVALAIGFAAWHFYKTCRRDADPCCGCEGCPLRQESGDRRQESVDMKGTYCRKECKNKKIKEC